MKTVSLVLALAALSVPAAAGAAQTHSQHASPGKVAKAHAGKVKIYGTVTAISRTSVTVASASKSLTFQRGSVSLAGIRSGAAVEAEGSVRTGMLRLSAIHLDDRGLRTSATTKSSDGPAGDDRGGHGKDDGPGHH